MNSAVVVLLTVAGVALCGWHWNESRLMPKWIGILLLAVAGCIAFLMAAAAGLVFWASAAMVAVPITALARALIDKTRVRDRA